MNSRPTLDQLWQILKRRGEINDRAEAEALIREFIRLERQRLRAGAHSGLASGADRLNRQRFAIRKTQEIRRRLLRRRHLKLPPDLLVVRYRESPILSGVLPGRAELWKPILQRESADTIEIDLERFSFIDEPGRTLASIKRLAEVECEGLSARLHFRDERCLDIGPYLVLGEAWPCLSPFFSGGHMNTPVQKVIEAVGLRRLMRMTLAAVRDLENIWAFPIRQRYPFRIATSANLPFEPQRDQMLADDLCDEIDNWLGVPKPPLSLTPEGRAWLSSILLELLDNAQRHSNTRTKDGSWSVAAFMERRREGEDDPEYHCSVAILSVGETIDESLLTCSPRIARELDAYAARHSRIGISKETLRTVCALQDGITRDPEADARDRGGVGFQQVMEFVKLLGSTQKPQRDARLTIISGRSCIMLREPYIIGKSMGGPQSPRVIWFNRENSAEHPPDTSHVLDLRERLAGTIISISFTLDAEYLSEKIDANNRPRRAHE